MTRLIETALTIPLLASLVPALAQTDWEVVSTFHTGGQGGWDYLTVDPQTHRLFVPRTTHTMVIDVRHRAVPRRAQVRPTSRAAAFVCLALSSSGDPNDKTGSSAGVLYRH
jgi:hypothetical protein